MDSYDKVAKVVAPKKAALAEAEAMYQGVMTQLRAKQVRLRAYPCVCMCVCVCVCVCVCDAVGASTGSSMRPDSNPSTHTYSRPHTRTLPTRLAG